MPKPSLKALVGAVIAAAVSLNAPAQAVQNMPIDDTNSGTTTNDVWSTIDRLNQNNPSAFLRIRVAQEAGQSELVSAIVQAAASAASPADVQAAVEAAILRIGGLNGRNVMSLAQLLAALEALGLSESVITATLNAYSTEVAEAVANGDLSPQLAAAVLTGDAQEKLYGNA
jgi:hypothetical protein